MNPPDLVTFWSPFPVIAGEPGMSIGLFGRGVAAIDEIVEHSEPLAIIGDEGGVVVY